MYGEINCDETILNIMIEDIYVLHNMYILTYKHYSLEEEYKDISPSYVNKGHPLEKLYLIQL